jgi:hypothetical protein
MVQTV